MKYDPLEIWPIWNIWPIIGQDLKKIIKLNIFLSYFLFGMYLWVHSRFCESIILRMMHNVVYDLQRFIPWNSDLCFQSICIFLKFHLTTVELGTVKVDFLQTKQIEINFWKTSYVKLRKCFLTYFLLDMSLCVLTFKILWTRFQPTYIFLKF